MPETYYTPDGERMIHQDYPHLQLVSVPDEVAFHNMCDFIEEMPDRIDWFLFDSVVNPDVIKKDMMNRIIF